MKCSDCTQFVGCRDEKECRYWQGVQRHEKRIDIEWKNRRGELVATAYGRIIAVRKAGKRYTAHFGPDRWIIGTINSRYKTEATAKAAAIQYAQQASDSARSDEVPE